MRPEDGDAPRRPEKTLRTLIAGLGITFVVISVSAWPVSSSSRDDLELLDSYQAAATAPGPDLILTRAAVPVHPRAPSGSFSLPGFALRGGITFYQRFLSSQDAPACIFSPSCSHYAQQAVDIHGPFTGILMASDRLQRCIGAARGYYRQDPFTGRLIDSLLTTVANPGARSSGPTSPGVGTTAGSSPGLPEFLEARGLYREAAVEYHRRSLGGGMDGLYDWLRAARSYRQAGRPDLALRQLDSLETQSGLDDSLRCYCELEKSRCNHDLGDPEQALARALSCRDLCRALPRETGDARLIAVASLMRLDRLAEARLMADEADGFDTPQQNALRRLAALSERGLQERRPSPVIAAALSALIPGAGKSYVGRHAEGLYSLALHLVTAWQCLDGFHDNGRNSVKGWTAASIGAVLYAGNVYGSAAAANRVRTDRREEILREAGLAVERGMSQ